MRIEIQTCLACGARLKMIACTQERSTVERVSSHLQWGHSPPSRSQAKAQPQKTDPLVSLLTLNPTYAGLADTAVSWTRRVARTGLD